MRKILGMTTMILSSLAAGIWTWELIIYSPVRYYPFWDPDKTLIVSIILLCVLSILVGHKIYTNGRLYGLEKIVRRFSK